MEIDELNRRFGAPGRIVFRRGHCGYPEVSITCKYGAAEIALLGATVLSYRPTGHSPVLFFAKDHVYARGEEVHGGMPLCWPQFGRLAIEGMSPHGFARIMPFRVKSSQYSDEMAELVLFIESSAETRSVWPFDFRLEVRLSVSMKLNAYATTFNTGGEAFEYTAGFHPYLLARDLDATYVRGVDALEYIDAADMSRGTQSGDLAMGGAKNRVYALRGSDAPLAKHEAVLVDPGLKRAIAIASHGARNLTVWNPGGGPAFGDIGPDAWRKFVCVEPVTAWPKADRALLPGESETLAIAVQSVSLV